MNYTTIEQSKKLLEAGLDSESADLIYVSYVFDGPPKNGDKNLPTTFKDPETGHWYYVDFAEPFYNDDWAKNKKYPNIPCWSIGALLEMMPKKIEEIKGHTIELILGKPKKLWSIMYFDWTGLQHGYVARGNTLIEATYNMVIWLLEHNFLEKKNKNEDTSKTNKTKD